MTWQMARRVILILYGAGFLLFALLLVYAALSGDGAERLWLYLCVAAVAVAEAGGLLLFHRLARLGLKIALALGLWSSATGVIAYGAWQSALVPIGFAGLLLLEFGFVPVDRRIAEGRRAAGAGKAQPSARR